LTEPSSLFDLNNCTTQVRSERKPRTRSKTNIFEDISAALALRGLGDLHSVANSDELTINVLETSGQSSLDRLFDLLLDQSGGERTKRLVKEVVVRIPNGKLEVADFDMDAVDLEDGGAITSRGVEFDSRLEYKKLQALIVTFRDETNDAHSVPLHRVVRPQYPNPLIWQYQSSCGSRKRRHAYLPASAQVKA